MLLWLDEGGNAKQVPLVYVLMSGKSRDNYSAVFTPLLGQLSDLQAVVTISADYKVGMWQVTHQVLVGVTHY